MRSGNHGAGAIDNGRVECSGIGLRPCRCGENSQHEDDGKANRSWPDEPLCSKNVRPHRIPTCAEQAHTTTQATRAAQCTNSIACVIAGNNDWKLYTAAAIQRKQPHAACEGIFTVCTSNGTFCMATHRTGGGCSAALPFQPWLSGLLRTSASRRVAVACRRWSYW